MHRLLALFALLFVTPALAQPATTTAPGTLLTQPLTIQPVAKSLAAWTTNGARFANPSVTLTDTSSSGTVAAAYTDLFSGDTIAASSSVTYTNYYGGYRTAPVAGTNVTITNAWAFGADSIFSKGTIQSGLSGTAGQLVLGNATSGLLTIKPVTGALGTVTASLPANTGTIAELNLAQTWSANQTFGANNLICCGGSTTAGPLIGSSAGVITSEQYITLGQGGLGGSQSAATANQIPVFPGSSGAGVPTSLGAWFTNVFSSSQGSIAYQNGSSTWAALAPSTQGFVLQTQGTGANPQWVGMLDGWAHLRPYVSQLANNVPLAGTVAWDATDPTGQPISCTGTHSNCLNEFLAAATSNGWNAEVVCQARYGGNGGGFPDPPVGLQLTSSVEIVFPVSENWTFRAMGCDLNVSPQTVNNPGIHIDTCGDCDIEWSGVIVYQPANSGTQAPTSCGVDIEPLTSGADGFAGIYDGRISFLSVVAYQASTTLAPFAAVCANAETGVISDEHIFVGELNIDDDFSQHIVPYGFATQGASGFYNNYVELLDLHGSSTYGVYDNQNNTSLFYGNIWIIPNIAAYTGDGVLSYGTNSTWIVGSVTWESTPNTGFLAASTTGSNTITVNLINGGTAKSDAGPAQGSAGANEWIGPQVGISCSSVTTVKVSGGIVGAC